MSLALSALGLAHAAEFWARIINAGIAGNVFHPIRTRYPQRWARNFTGSHRHPVLQ